MRIWKNKKYLFEVILLIIGCFLFASADCQAETYYVDGDTGLDTNPGTLENPWETIHQANITLTAGDTVYIRGGISDYQTYYIGELDTLEEGVYPHNSGTGADSRITYSVYPGEKVNFIANTYFATAIQIEDKNWIKVTGRDGSTSAMNWKFSNMNHHLWIWSALASGGAGSHYNEISHIDFSGTFIDIVPVWQANHDYSPGDFVKPSVERGFVYQLTTDGGFSGAGEPAWSLDHIPPNNTTVDGGLTWTTRVAVDYRGSTIYRNSQYNWIHYCSFSNYGFYATNEDGGTLFELGNEEVGHGDTELDPDTDHTAFNVIEDNRFFHGGHHTFGLHSLNNVVRRNHFHNEQWWDNGVGQLYGYRNLYVAGDWDTNHGWNLVEGNRISHAAGNLIPTNYGGGGISLSQSNDIIRYNDFYANAGHAVYIQCTYGAGNDHEECNNNRIYNNSFFANGYGATYDQPARNSWDRRPIVFAASTEETFTTYMMNNVVKNNLFWKNYQGPEGGLQIISGMFNDGYDFDNCSSNPCGNTIIAPNFIDTDGNPLLASEGSYGNPTIGTTEEWYFDSADETSITDPDMDLQLSSPAIDDGTNLTAAIGSGNNSTILLVEDARYFQDGRGDGAGVGASVEKDWIAIGTSNNHRQISSIDYETNTITLATAATWSDEASIWLSKKSDGATVLQGSAPDYGAFEFGADAEDETAPGAPRGLLIQ